MEVLIIEDQSWKALLLQEYLEQFNCTSTVSPTVDRGLHLIKSNNYPVVFVDYHLPDGKGTDVLKACKEIGKKIRFVLNSSDKDANENYASLGFDERVEGIHSIERIVANLV